MFFFTSPTSSITLPPVPHPSPAYTSTAMSRSDSRDSTTSNTSFISTSSDTYHHNTSAAWDISLRPRSSSSMCSALSERRDSSSSASGNTAGWLPSPYRSCQLRSGSFTSEPSSYISDDDLLCISPDGEDQDDRATMAPTSIPSERRELTTEEQIAIIRAQRDREDAAIAFAQRQQAAKEKKARMVRFMEATTQAQQRGQERRASSGGQVLRRPSPLKRRGTTVRKNLAQLS